MTREPFYGLLDHSTEIHELEPAEINAVIIVARINQSRGYCCDMGCSNCEFLHNCALDADVTHERLLDRRGLLSVRKYDKYMKSRGKTVTHPPAKTRLFRSGRLLPASNDIASPAPVADSSDGYG